MKNHKLPEPVIRRLPRYYRCLELLRDSGVERTSSGKLAELMSSTASQVRQDFSCFGKLGQQGYGYNVSKLISEFGDILGMKTVRSMILIGAGHLGSAIANNFDFEHYGFRLIAAFDNSKELIGTVIRPGIEIYDIDRLEEFVEEYRPQAAVLTLTQTAAQPCAERLVRCGVKYLWNFANTELKLEDTDAVVEDVRFSDSILVLSYYMT
ncbi:MAG: redox-sensing transcriptional repressor Rex [Oscillospiraceae bacterium]|nr:redox-sensing transcriptional repressor Rex [Oscillospiraceae bacterium]